MKKVMIAGIASLMFASTAYASETCVKAKQLFNVNVPGVGTRSVLPGTPGRIDTLNSHNNQYRINWNHARDLNGAKLVLPDDFYTVHPHSYVEECY